MRRLCVYYLHAQLIVMKLNWESSRHYCLLSILLGSFVVVVFVVVVDNVVGVINFVDVEVVDQLMFPS